MNRNYPNKLVDHILLHVKKEENPDQNHFTKNQQKCLPEENIKEIVNTKIYHPKE
jgi:hypothetical protein